MFHSRSYTSLLGGCLAIALVVSSSGCLKKSSGGGDSSAFDGTGGEDLGTWVMVITDSTGIYKTDHYGPAGISVAAHLSLNGTNQLQINPRNRMGGNSTFVLTPSPATGGYVGKVSYNLYKGPRNGDKALEIWTVRPVAGGGATISVSGTSSGTVNGTSKGTLTARLYPTVGYTNSLSADWYGVSSKSDDARFTGEGGIYEEYNQNPGTRAYYYWDGAWDWCEDLYVDMMYRDGAVLRGGGWYSGCWNPNGDYRTTFGTIQVNLDASGHPISSSATVHQGYGTNATTATISHSSYVNAQVLDGLYDATATAHDLVVASVTPGGELESRFGIVGKVNTGWVRSYGNYLDISPIGSLSAGAVAPNTRTWTIWNPNAYLFPGSNKPSWDIDGLGATVERLTVTINYNATTHIPTSGSMKLEIFDDFLNALGTETMTFTIP